MEKQVEDFLKTLTWYFGSKPNMAGIFQRTEEIKDQLTNLNNNLLESNKSAGKLTKALKVITFTGVIISASTLFFEIYKYLKPIF